MKTFQLAGQLRNELGKKAAKGLRAGDQIPAVLYGGNEVLHFTVSQEGVRNLVYSPDIFAIDLDIEGRQSQGCAEGSSVPPSHRCYPAPGLPTGRG